MLYEKISDVTSDDLKRLVYQSARHDKPYAAEVRRNLRAVNGLFYTNRNQNENRYGDGGRLPNILNNIDNSEQRVQISLNQITRVSEFFQALIISHAPIGKAYGANKDERQDIKAAEISNHVLDHINQICNFPALRDQIGETFINAGEGACKIYFDPDKGHLVRTDENGRGIFSGDITMEPILPFNLLMDPMVDSPDESKWFAIKKIIHVNDLKNLIGPEKFEELKLEFRNVDGTPELNREGFRVLDTSMEVAELNNHLIMFEVYFRPCPDYPMGAYFYVCENQILFSGELPGGIFPICIGRCHIIPTSPRGRAGFINRAIPYQANFNRAHSKMVEIQAALGDTKILVQNGSTIGADSIMAPGVRAFTFETSAPGEAPVVLEERTGESYISYIKELKMSMDESLSIRDFVGSQGSESDKIMSIAVASLKHKRRYAPIINRFDKLVVDIQNTALELARHHYEDGKIIKMAGRQEAVNISEFKGVDRNTFSINIKPSVEDADSSLLKSLEVRDAFQYIQDDSVDKAALLKELPFLSKMTSVNSLSNKSKTAENKILALDRGEKVTPIKYEDYKYILDKLIVRVSEPDYKFLDQSIKDNYAEAINLYQDMIAETERRAKMAEKGPYTTSGPMDKLPIWIKDPQTGKVIQMRAPTMAIYEFAQALEEQKFNMQNMAMAVSNDEARAEIGERQAQGQSPPPPQA